MVEEIENVSAELHVEPLVQFGVFGQREIKVLEVRADESVAAEIAEVESADAGARNWVPIARRGESAERFSSLLGPPVPAKGLPITSGRSRNSLLLL